MEKPISRRDLVVFTLGCVGFGLYWFTCYASIQDFDLKLLNFTVWTRVVRIVCTFALALLFLGRTKLPRIAYIVAMIIQISSFMVPFIGRSVGGGGLINAILLAEGFPLAVFCLLFSQLFAQYPPGYSRIGIFAAFALAHGVPMVTQLFPSLDNGQFLSALLAISLALLFVCVVKKDLLVSDRVFVQELRTSGAFRLRLFEKDRRLERSKISNIVRNIIVYGTGVTILPLLYSILSQVSYYTDINKGLVDIVTQAFCIIALLVLLLFIAIRDRPISLIWPFILMLPFLASALLVTPLFWDNIPFSSSIVFKCAYVLYFAILYSSLAQVTYARPKRTLTYFGLATGFAVSSLLSGREIGSIMQNTGSLAFEAMAAISLAAIWSLIFVSSVFAGLSMRGTAKTTDAPDGLSQSKRALTLEDKAVLFSKETGLSDRETQVLVSFIHGRSASHIAQQLHLSENTVRTYLSRIYTKADIHNRQALIDRIEAVCNIIP